MASRTVRSALLAFAYAGLIVASFVYLWFEKLGGWEAGLIIVLGGMGLALVAESDRLVEVGASKEGVRALLSDVKKATEDLYAKTEVVKELAEKMAAANAFSVAGVGRIGTGAGLDTLVPTRDNLDSLLAQLGTVEAKRAALLAPLNRIILHELGGRIRGEIEGVLRARFQFDEAKLTEAMQEIYPLLSLSGGTVPEPGGIAAMAKALDLDSGGLRKNIETWTRAASQLRLASASGSS